MDVRLRFVGEHSICSCRQSMIVFLYYKGTFLSISEFFQNRQVCLSAFFLQLSQIWCMVIVGYRKTMSKERGLPCTNLLPVRQRLPACFCAAALPQPPSPKSIPQPQRLPPRRNPPLWVWSCRNRIPPFPSGSPMPPCRAHRKVPFSCPAPCSWT